MLAHMGWIEWPTCRTSVSRTAPTPNCTLTPWTGLCWTGLRCLALALVCACNPTDGSDPSSGSMCEAGVVCTRDDMDAATTDSGHAEQCFDDSDCDGLDNPEACDAPLHPTTVAQRTEGVGPDMVVVHHTHCKCCEGCLVSLQIANIGTVPSPADVLVHVLSGPTEAEAGTRQTQATPVEFVFTGELSPGEVSQTVSRAVPLGRTEQREGYWIVVDPRDTVAESDESNNTVHADGAGIGVCQ